jgi:hypothetical protein
MDETSLKSLIASLEAHRDALGFWLNLFSGMVAGGVVAEIAFVVREYWENLHDWRRGIVRPPNRPSRTWFVFEVLGVALVSIGVAGEFFIDVKAGALETEIRKANSDLVGILETKITDEQVALMGAQTDLLKLEQTTAEAVKGIAAAKKVAASAESKLADATARTSRLEAQQSWRKITPEQKEKLKSLLLSSRILMPLSGLKIKMSFLSSDPEAQEYAVELKDALNGFGAEIPEPTGILTLGASVPAGVIVSENPARNPKANWLLNVLYKSGISVSGDRNDGMDSSSIGILVGTKPTPKHSVSQD